MTARRQISAAALVSLLGLASLLLYLYWRDVVSLIAMLIAGRLAWAIIAQKAGIRRKRGKGLGELALAGAFGYLFGRSSTHPCGQCGKPIDGKSRANYCSPACRNYASLERRETQRQATALAAFGDFPEGF